MYKKIELYKKPADILEKIGEHKAEMSPLQHGFLCGLLKEYRPKKVLEIGVSAGGTTAVILNCLQEAEIKSEMYSVDLLNNYYLDTTKKVGYQVDDAKEYLSNLDQHHLLLGNVIPCFLDEIGKDIDFLIIDTMHILPGEILDFIVCLPYLAPNAIVVLHDIALNHSFANGNEYATKVLFDTVVADKFLCLDEGYPNIGAFQITEDTQKYIMDCFSSLTISWCYDPTDQYLGEYRKKICEHYSEEYIEIFDIAVDLNKKSMEHYMNRNPVANQINDKVKLEIEEFNKLWENKKEIMFYGVGKRGKDFNIYAKNHNRDIAGFIVSDDQTISEADVDGKKVVKLSSVSKEDTLIVLTTSFTEVREKLIEGKYNFYEPSYNFVGFVERYLRLING